MGIVIPSKERNFFREENEKMAKKEAGLKPPEQSQETPLASSSSQKPRLTMIKNFVKKTMLVSSLRATPKNNDIIPLELQEIEEILYESPELKEKVDKYGSLKKTLGKGAMFGEKALLQPVNRSASIICLEDTEFIILFKKDFDKVKKYYNKENIEKKEYLLSNLPCLDSVTGENLILDFVTNFVPRNYSRGHKLQVEGGECNNLYLLKEGRLTLEKEITHEMMNEGRPSNKAEYVVASSQKNVKICELTNGALVGDECLKGLDAQYTVYVQSMSCTVYWLDKQLLKFYPKIMIGALKKNFKIKRDHRREYIQKVIMRFRLERDLLQEPISIPTVVAQMLDTMHQNTRERLLGNENVKRNLRNVPISRTPEELLVKQTELQDSLRKFYGKFTRKVNYNTLSRQDIRDATYESDFLFLFTIEISNRKKYLAVKNVKKSTGRFPANQPLFQKEIKHSSIYRQPGFIDSSKSISNSQRFSQTEPSQIMTNEEALVLREQLTRLNQADAKEEPPKQVGFHLRAESPSHKRDFVMRYLESEKELKSKQIQKGIIKIQKNKYVSPDLAAAVRKKTMSMTRLPKLSFVNVPGNAGNSFSRTFISVREEIESSRNALGKPRVLFASFNARTMESSPFNGRNKRDSPKLD